MFSRTGSKKPKTKIQTASSIDHLEKRLVMRINFKRGEEKEDEEEAAEKRLPMLFSFHTFFLSAFNVSDEFIWLYIKRRLFEKPTLFSSSARIKAAEVERQSENEFLKTRGDIDPTHCFDCQVCWRSIRFMSADRKCFDSKFRPRSDRRLRAQFVDLQCDTISFRLMCPDIIFIFFFFLEDSAHGGKELKHENIDNEPNSNVWFHRW